MKKSIIIFTVFVLSAFKAGAAGKIVTDSLFSTVLGETVKYNVYLPEGFGKNDIRYPAVYLLHGLYGNYTDWAAKGSVKMIADELISSGEAVPMVIFMPNAGNKDARKVWNGYFNMEGWHYEDFFFNEFIPAAENKYNVKGNKENRAVMGLSMGGGGSTVYCQRHPEMFSSCYAMSPWLDYLGSLDGEKDKLLLERQSVHENSAIAFMDKADAQALAKLRTVKWVFDCGDDDHLVDLSIQLHNKMKAAGVKDELIVRDGIHNWEYWRISLRNALPFASRNFCKADYAVHGFSSKIVTDSLYSHILGTYVKYHAYLPDGYGKDGRKYPVVYLLHGLSDDCNSWLKKGNMKLVADEMIECGEAEPMVIIMPNAGDVNTHEIWNGYFNMDGWRYEDFFFNEFMPYVEPQYNVKSDKGHRAIMGLSMGGGGSTVYCQHHPESFSSCYSMSGWLDNTDQAGLHSNKKDKLFYECESVHEHSALDFIDRADEDVKEQLRTVKWFFDCGDDDFLLRFTTGLHMKMRDAGIKDELRIRNGVHNWEYWHQALRQAIPFASRNFDK